MWVETLGMATLGDGTAVNLWKERGSQSLRPLRHALTGEIAGYRIDHVQCTQAEQARSRILSGLYPLLTWWKWEDSVQSAVESPDLHGRVYEFPRAASAKKLSRRLDCLRARGALIALRWRPQDREEDLREVSPDIVRVPVAHLGSWRSEFASDATLCVSGVNESVHVNEALVAGARYTWGKLEEYPGGPLARTRSGEVGKFLEWARSSCSIVRCDEPTAKMPAPIPGSYIAFLDARGRLLRLGFGTHEVWAPVTIDASIRVGEKADQELKQAVPRLGNQLQGAVVLLDGQDRFHGVVRSRRIKDLLASTALA